MAMRKEYDLEQIDSLSELLVKILFPEGFGKSEIENFVFDGNLNDLKLKLKKLTDLNRFGEAQDLLFDEIENCGQDNRSGVLQLAVWFYMKIDGIDDETLQRGGFSRHEIREGLEKIEKLVIGI